MPRPSHESRRFLPLPSALIVTLLALAVFVQGTDAQRAWCRTDPVVSISGTLSDVWVLGPLTASTKVTGPNQIEITVPTGVKASTVLTTLGFGRGEVVTWKWSSSLTATNKSVQVRVRVYVPATDNAMPVRVEFAPRIITLLWPTVAEGKANTWVELTATFKPALLLII